MNVMNMNSAFSSGVLGLQKATNQLDNSASRIAQQSVSSSSADSNGTTVQTGDVLPDALVQLKQAELQGKASAEVIKRSDQMLGSLIDIHV